MEVVGLCSRALCSKLLRMKWIAWTPVRVWHCMKAVHLPLPFWLSPTIYSIIVLMVFVLLRKQWWASSARCHYQHFIQGWGIRTSVPQLLCWLLLLLIHRTRDPVKPAALPPLPPLPSIFPFSPCVSCYPNALLSLFSLRLNTAHLPSPSISSKCSQDSQTSTHNDSTCVEL